MALSTFYKRKFIKDHQVFSEAIITSNVEDVKKECIGIKKNGFEFEFNKATDITLFKALLGVLNDLLS